MKKKSLTFVFAFDSYENKGSKTVLFNFQAYE